MKRILLILLVGLILGLIDLIPLLFTNAPIFNMVAIVSFWVVAAVMMAKTRFVANDFVDGLLMGVLLMLPLILTVTAVNPKDFFPMLLMAVILGPICGLLLGKFGLRKA